MVQFAVQRNLHDLHAATAGWSTGNIAFVISAGVDSIIQISKSISNIRF